MQGHIHLHTKASDGLIDPEHIIEAGLDFVAVTDHDTLEGIERFYKLKEYGIEVVPGIELSARHMGKNMHMLVYYPTILDQSLPQVLVENRQRRTNRALKMASKLRNLGFRIEDEDILSKPGIVTKGNIATIVMSYPENLDRLKEEGEDRWKVLRYSYLEKGCPAHVELKGMEIRDLFKLVNGVKVLAHPDKDLERGKDDYIVEDLARNYGLWGIEIWTRRHKEVLACEHYKGIADRLGLYKTRSNDVHHIEEIYGNYENERTLNAIKSARRDP